MSLSASSFYTLVLAALVVFLAQPTIELLRLLRRRLRSTSLRGPKRTTFVYGVSKSIGDNLSAAATYAQWALDYGSVYRIPTAMGTSRVVVTDPRAIAHIYTNDTYAIQRTPHGKLSVELLAGRNVLWAEGDRHRELRNTLAPGLSAMAVRELLPIFYDSAYTLKSTWDAMFGTKDEVVIDVQLWMNRMALDTIGLAAFSHDFGTLHHRPSEVIDSLDTMGSYKTTRFSAFVKSLSRFVPVLSYVPTESLRMYQEFKRTTGDVGRALASRRMAAGKGIDDERSVLSVLAKAQLAVSGRKIDDDEVVSQIRLLISAGYETTSVSLTWCYIELARHAECQQRLREELETELHGRDPTWEELSNPDRLPYLHAVVHEVLRLHPPTVDNERQAAEDVIVPLSSPLTLSSGKETNSIVLAKGVIVIIPIQAIHQSESVWGPDAKMFKPERWLDGGKHIPDTAKKYRGFQNLLTFIDGPRMCIGRTFVLGEIKALLSVIMRSYEFEMRDGPLTKLGNHRSALLRPKVEGEPGLAMPMRVRRLEQ